MNVPLSPDEVNQIKHAYQEVGRTYHTLATHMSGWNALEVLPYVPEDAAANFGIDVAQQQLRFLNNATNTLRLLDAQATTKRRLSSEHLQMIRDLEPGILEQVFELAPVVQTQVVGLMEKGLIDEHHADHRKHDANGLISIAHKELQMLFKMASAKVIPRNPGFDSPPSMQL